MRFLILALTLFSLNPAMADRSNIHHGFIFSQTQPYNVESKPSSTFAYNLGIDLPKNFSASASTSITNQWVQFREKSPEATDLSIELARNLTTNLPFNLDNAAMSISSTLPTSNISKKSEYNGSLGFSSTALWKFKSVNLAPVINLQREFHKFDSPSEQAGYYNDLYTSAIGISVSTQIKNKFSLASAVNLISITNAVGSLRQVISLSNSLTTPIAKGQALQLSLLNQDRFIENMRFYENNRSAARLSFIMEI
jgi:hypothetical protein